MRCAFSAREFGEDGLWRIIKEELRKEGVNVVGNDWLMGDNFLASLEMKGPAAPSLESECL
ncbi:MAG: hypothetical protein IBJ00_03840 [Alphaproteobacteria bacterium]|nr:hypothetical protein [Alphaproteobacteria bacterium]